MQCTQRKWCYPSWGLTSCFLNVSRRELVASSNFSHGFPLCWSFHFHYGDLGLWVEPHQCQHLRIMFRTIGWIITVSICVSSTLNAQEESWRYINYSFGFSRIGIINDPMEENSVFNPSIQFELTYSQSLKSRLGFKAGVGYATNWVYTRSKFIQGPNRGDIFILPQDDFRLNTYIRSNHISAFIGPQFRISRNKGESVFVSILYVPAYNLNHRMQYRVAGENKTYGYNLKPIIRPFWHQLALDINVNLDKSSSDHRIFNSFTMRATFDLTPYASNGEFLPYSLGFLFGF